jgi:hypothetical protein
MTTFQDPPPQSRRSARQNERSEHDQSAQQTGQTGTFYPAQPVAPGAPPAPSSHATAGHTAQPGGRRASRAAQQGLYEVQPEPLAYMTQGQPTGDYSTGSAPTAAPNAAGYQVRDFSPEHQTGRRAATPLVEPPQATPQQATPPSDLEYRTQQVPPGAGYTTQPTSAPGGTRSRREMRESAQQPSVPPFGHAEFATGVQQPFTAGQPLNPTQQPYATQQHSAPAQSQSPPPAVPAPAAPPAGAGRRAAPTPPPPPTNLTTAMAEFEALARANAAPPHPGARAATPPSAPTAVQAPPVPVPVTGAPVAGAPAAPTPATPAAGYVAPAGHWSRQADLDDETQPWGSTITREVGVGHASTTTSTLILPDIPRPSNFSTALNSTGEVLLTGSIDLPRSLSSMGADSRQYDNADVDHMFDQHEREYSGTDSSPVRAARAVSTHTSSRGVIHTTAPHGNRMLTVLFVTALGLAVAVSGFFIYAISNNIF